MAKEVKKDEKKEVKEKKSNDKKSSYFKDFKAELKRVKWPTRKELFNSTMAVLASVILIAVIVFVLDVIFENAFKLTNNGLQSLITSNTEESTDTNELTYVDTTEDGTSEEATNTTEDSNEVVQGEVISEGESQTITEDTTSETTENVQ